MSENLQEQAQEQSDNQYLVDGVFYPLTPDEIKAAECMTIEQADANIYEADMLMVAALDAEASASQAEAEAEQDGIEADAEYNDACNAIYQAEQEETNLQDYMLLSEFDTATDELEILTDQYSKLVNEGFDDDDLRDVRMKSAEVRRQTASDALLMLQGIDKNTDTETLDYNDECLYDDILDVEVI